MKIPFNIFGKKIAATFTTAATTNEDDSNSETMGGLNIWSRFNTNLHRSHSVPNYNIMSNSDCMDNFCDDDNNNNKNNINIDSASTSSSTRNMNLLIQSVTDSEESILDVNSNITSKHRDSATHSSSNSNSRQLYNHSNSLDFDINDTNSNNDTFVDKRVSMDSSDSTQWDSGFSSSCCLGDEKDDTISVQSQDFTFDYYDNKYHGSLYIRPFVSHSSILTRPRSYSADSASSDISAISETPKLNSNVSSSLPLWYNCSATDDDIDIIYNKTRWSYDDLSVPSNNASALRRRFKIKRRKFITRSKPIPQPTTTDDEDIETHHDDNVIFNDFNNNAWTRVDDTGATMRNLQSRLPSPPFQFVDAFQKHGLVSLVGCVSYTIFLVVGLGFLALGWQLFTKFVSKSDLKEFRDEVMEKRLRRRLRASNLYETEELYDSSDGTK